MQSSNIKLKPKVFTKLNVICWITKTINSDHKLKLFKVWLWIVMQIVNKCRIKVEKLLRRQGEMEGLLLMSSIILKISFWKWKEVFLLVRRVWIRGLHLPTPREIKNINRWRMLRKFYLRNRKNLKKFKMISTWKNPFFWRKRRMKMKKWQNHTELKLLLLNQKWKGKSRSQMKEFGRNQILQKGFKSIETQQLNWQLSKTNSRKNKSKRRNHLWSRKVEINSYLKSINSHPKYKQKHKWRRTGKSQKMRKPQAWLQGW